MKFVDTFYDHQRKILVRSLNTKSSMLVAEHAEYLFTIKGENISLYIDNKNYHSKNTIMVSDEYLKMIKMEKLN